MKILGDSNLQLLKICALFLLVVFFSTNYYGGNALFFLTSEMQFIVKTVTGVTGVTGAVLFLIYLSLVNKSKRELIEKNNYSYTKDAFEYMVKNNISEKNVEKTILYGKKTKRNSSIKYTWKAEDGNLIVVILNDQGHIFSIIT